MNKVIKYKLPLTTNLLIISVVLIFSLLLLFIFGLTIATYIQFGILFLLIVIINIQDKHAKLLDKYNKIAERTVELKSKDKLK